MPWTPLDTLKERILEAGGFVNAHAHFDRAYTVTLSDVVPDQGNSNRHLFEKWELVNDYKANANEETYYSQIGMAMSTMDKQGVQATLSFVDCDPISGDRALKAALRVKEESDGKLLLACQTLRGVRHPAARACLERALEHIDIIGGLPKKDAPHEKDHLHTLFSMAKATGKRVHVHVDQLNTPHEKETELLARMTMLHGLEGRVTAIHSISLASHPEAYRREVYKMCRDAGLSFVACPTAWIDARRSPVLSPTHNAITPLDELLEEGLTVAIGTDNIADIYKPFCDGDMMTELRVLLEATHTYDIDALVDVATVNGLEVLGLLD